ncbi:aspartate/glutamate racemase family protein [Cutibacterium sp.]|uniref:aspartate/glutamate racemase family protein n=1 Tax=Cutibacterium sp. TaxID=1912221 RepID=UPI0026DD4A44|nr:aspartate/glutamate racemase family protein [Cutibacterium sp.]MDO4411553.1 aspartate/glutamate racemase family protein [Cutibacterium sp.]
MRLTIPMLPPEEKYNYIKLNKTMDLQEDAYMANPTIAVMAGTHIDTEFGATLARNLTDHIISIPISNTPEEQTLFQTMDDTRRLQKIRDVISQHSDISCLLVYCNSLSGSVDFKSLSKECGIHIITPLDFYSHIATQYTSFGIITANAQGSAGIEKSILDENARARIYSISNLDWVDAVEANATPASIYEELGLREAIGVYEKLQVDCIVLGCTHFPYFQDYLQEQTKLACISPDQYILNELTKCL